MQPPIFGASATTTVIPSAPSVTVVGPAIWKVVKSSLILQMLLLTGQTVYTQEEGVEEEEEEEEEAVVSDT